MTTVLYATDVQKAQISDALTTVQNNQTLESQITGDDITDHVTEATVSGGEGDLDALNFFGRNQEVEESRPGLIEVELSLAYQGMDLSQYYFGTGSTSTGDFKRVDGSDMTNRKPDKAVFLHYETESKQINILMNHSKATGRGEISQSGDGHAELTVTFSCKVEDYYEEEGDKSELSDSMSVSDSLSTTKNP